MLNKNMKAEDLKIKIMFYERKNNLDFIKLKKKH